LTRWQWRCRALLTAWLNTPTWTESLNYYRLHRSDLTAGDARAILASADDNTARQHLAILDLADWTPVERVYSLVTDAAAAEDATFEAIEQGDLTKLASIATAATTLHTRPSTAHFTRREAARKVPPTGTSARGRPQRPG
jgi:hypothetical protein